MEGQGNTAIRGASQKEWDVSEAPEDRIDLSEGVRRHGITLKAETITDEGRNEHGMITFIISVSVCEVHVGHVRDSGPWL